MFDSVWTFGIEMNLLQVFLLVSCHLYACWVFIINRGYKDLLHRCIFQNQNLYITCCTYIAFRLYCVVWGWMIQSCSLVVGNIVKVTIV